MHLRGLVITATKTFCVSRYRFFLVSFFLKFSSTGDGARRFVRILSRCCSYGTELQSRRRAVFCRWRHSSQLQHVVSINALGSTHISFGESVAAYFHRV